MSLSPTFYQSEFNKTFHQTGNFDKTLIETVNLYLQKETLNNETTAVLKQFLEHIPTAPVGKKSIGFDFSFSLPEVLSSLIDDAVRLETSLKRDMYLRAFQNAYNAELNFDKALKAAVDLYMQQPDAKEEVTSVLKRFTEHVAQVGLGRKVISFEFGKELPEALQHFINMARLKEQSLLLQPSTLVSNCENEIAGSGHSAKAYFEQTACLERALKEKKVPSHQVNEVKFKLNEWLNCQYKNFALLILESKTPEILQENFKKAFDPKTSDGLEKLEAVRHELECQLEYLDEKHFLEAFFDCKDYSQQYELAYEFYYKTKESGAMTIELKATIASLFYEICEKAYVTCKKQKHKLMSVRTNTIDDLFQALTQWVKKEWVVYDGQDLLSELRQRLDTEEKYLRTWDEVGRLQSGSKSSMPAYQVHCYKYCGDPNADPSKVLRDIKLMASPQKRKSNALYAQETQTISLSDLYSNEESKEESLIRTKTVLQTQDSKNVLQALKCDEKLDFDEFNTSSKKNKQLK